MSWISTKEQEPPKDRLIIVTNGITWMRKDDHQDSVIKNGKELIPARIYTHLVELGKIYLIYWSEQLRMWKEFGGGLGPTEFDYWMDFENPIKSVNEEITTLGLSINEEIPNVCQMVYGDSQYGLRKKLNI